MVDNLEVEHSYTLQRHPYLEARLKASACFVNLVINFGFEPVSLGLCLLYIGLALPTGHPSDRLVAALC